jgi:hypothetical protein
LKLSKAPNMRTVIIAVLAFILIGTAVDALAKELRVTTAADLVNCVSGVALAAGPDAGKVAAAGDTCVVFPGTYDLALPNGPGVPADIVIENLTLRSTNGATATIITFTGGYLGGLVNIVNRGVTVGGPAPDQGFTITNPAPGGGVGICVTDPGIGGLCGKVVAGGQAANENITIQNNTIRQNANEGILFHYDIAVTAIDTIRILKNDIRNNGGDGLAFDNTVGAIGRRGVDRNVVIDGNKFDDNGNGANLAGAGVGTFANIHFYNNTSIEQLAILNNEINRAGATAGGPADGILFNNDPFAGNGLTEIRDALIDRNIIQFNTQNGIKFDYAGRLGENVTISNNRGVTPDQGITHNGPAVVPGEGNGIYITGRVNDVRELKIVNNAINSNRGWDGTFPPAAAADLDLNGVLDVCRHGNGLSIEAGGRVENLTLDGNDFRQNFNNGVCIANNGDFSRSTVTNNKFHNNGVGDYINSVAEAPYGDGFGVYHDPTINGGAALWVWASASRASPSPATTTARTAGITPVQRRHSRSWALRASALGSSCAWSAARSAGSPSRTRTPLGTSSAASAWRRIPMSLRTAPATSARSPGRTSPRWRAKALLGSASLLLMTTTSATTATALVTSPTTATSA